MFCRNCGKELPNDVKFCNHCGAPQGVADASQSTQPPHTQQSYMPPPPHTQQFYTQQQPTAEPQQRPGLKIGGIILLICGVFSVAGGFANGSFMNMAEQGLDLANIVTILVQLGLVFGGIRMIAKSKGSRQPAPRPCTQQQPDTKPQWRMGLLVVGIVLLVFGVLTVAASYSGGDYRFMADRMQRGYYLPDDLEMILMQMGMIVGGIVLLCLSKRRK